MRQQSASGRARLFIIEVAGFDERIGLAEFAQPFNKPKFPLLIGRRVPKPTDERDALMVGRNEK